MLEPIIPTTSAPPIVIAHRGASGYLPEHTLAAKLLAFEQGANYLEQDVVLSQDGVPVVLHDIYLDTVSDVATKYPHRQRADGRYYALDFTWAELQTLRLSERFNPATGSAVYPNRYPVGFGEFAIVSLQQELEFIAGLPRAVGIYPEIKAPFWHRQQGYDISLTVLSVLAEYGYTSAEQAIYLQCFDAHELRRIHDELGCKLPLIQLIAGAQWAQPHEYVLANTRDLAAVARYATGIGPWLPLVIHNRNNRFSSAGLVEAAHHYGLQVHPYTLRVDDLPEGVSDDGPETYTRLLQAVFETAKADGAFTDFPDILRGYIDQGLPKS